MQYYFRYVLDLVCAPGGAMILGIAGHEAGAHNLKQKITSGVDLPLKEVKEVFSASFDEKVKEGLNQNYQDDVKCEIDWDAPVGQVKDQGIGLAEVFHEQVAPITKPRHVELKVLDTTGKGRPFLGYIDCIEEDGTITDFKYQGKSETQSNADQNLQLTFYSLMTRTDTSDDNVRLDIIVKNKKPVHKRVDSVRTEQQRLWAQDLLERVESSIQAGIFIPHNAASGNYLCSRKFCGYYKMCGYGGGPATD